MLSVFVILLHMLYQCRKIAHVTNVYCKLKLTESKVSCMVKELQILARGNCFMWRVEGGGGPVTAGDLKIKGAASRIKLKH